jgi:hypothetical protein
MVLGIVYPEINLTFGQVKQLKKSVMPMGLDDPVVQSRALWNPLEIEGVGPAWGCLIAVQIEIGDAFAANHLGGGDISDVWIG